MNMHCESTVLEDYLVELDEVDFSHAVIQEVLRAVLGDCKSEVETVHKAYEFVRDEISHSWDIQSSKVTRKASEVLTHREGICYAKSNLLAALLRAKNIPTGFCYQRLTLGDTPESGYCIHALNAVYFSTLKRWIRLDARGNKEGIQAIFSLQSESLAFPIRESYDEIDYPTIYTRPNRETMEVLKVSDNCLYMYLNNLPTQI